MRAGSGGNELLCVCVGAKSNQNTTQQRVVKTKTKNAKSNRERSLWQKQVMKNENPGKY